LVAQEPCTIPAAQTHGTRRKASQTFAKGGAQVQVPMAASTEAELAGEDDQLGGGYDYLSADTAWPPPPPPPPPIETPPPPRGQPPQRPPAPSASRQPPPPQLDDAADPFGEPLTWGGSTTGLNSVGAPLPTASAASSPTTASPVAASPPGGLATAGAAAAVVKSAASPSVRGRYAALPEEVRKLMPLTASVYDY
jgi:hypothetical protein